MDIQRKKRKKRKVDWYIVLTPVFAVVALTAMLACFCTIGYYQVKEEKAKKEAEEALAMAPVTYTQEEVDTMVKSAVTLAVDEAVRENSDEIFNDMRSRMENGDSTTSMLRDFYPENIVLYEKGKYVFKDILDTIKHNNLEVENIKKDEESGEITYVEDAEVISHKGIDVSKFQGDIDWESVKEDGVEYAFLRLGIRGYTTGEMVLDETFEENVEGALEQDINVGVYFFTQAVTEEEAVEEADFVIENLEPYEINYPVVIDVEDVNSSNARTNELTPEERTRFVIAFCERIKEAGYTPMVYGNLKTFMLMLDITQLEDYEKWYAYYSTDEFYYPYDFSVWQYSDEGSVDGIETDVDMNISFKEW
ncbi:MAG: glycoside hydrolase family 25 protein [Lachnospiraceae bacterium]|nr:glycoside hydrolase family 25 protein [Lachnospiraceae bacterium]